VYLAGQVASPLAQVVPPCRLEYYEPVFDISKAVEFYPQFSADWILDLDDDLGIVYKPPGLPTTPARDQVKYNLARYLADHFGAPVHTPSRLDTGVDGLLLFSRSSRMNRALQRAYDKHRIEKLYLALVSPAIEWKMLDVEAPIGRDRRHPVLRCVDAERGESAHTQLNTLVTEGNCTLVQAQPFTGRTHQIRVHCAASGAPIVGDPYYGGSDAPRLHLTSFALRFFHPYQQEYKMYVLPKALRPEWLSSLDAKYGDSAERLLLNPVERYGV
jgi:23S rRNA-/tRNA-specific pseudouridylate synthase